MSKAKRLIKTIEMHKKMNSKLLKLERVMNTETMIKDTLHISNNDSLYRDVLMNMRQSLDKMATISSVSKRERYLKSFDTYFNNQVSGMVSWPPPRRNIELSAKILVDELSSQNMKERITSAMESDAVSGETNFWNKTVSLFLEDFVKPGDKELFINSVNKYIEVKNQNSYSSDKIRKLSHYWFRNK